MRIGLKRWHCSANIGGDGVLYNSWVNLINVTENKDAFGDIAEGYIRQAVACDVETVGRSEFYAANTAGYKAELSVKMRKALYGGQQILEYCGDRYTVIRSYSKDADSVELVCQRGVLS